MNIKKIQSIDSIEAINDDQLTSSVSPAKSGLALHQVFPQDSLEKPPAHSQKLSIQPEDQKQSFWKRWFQSRLEAPEKSSTVDSVAKTSDQATQQPINLLPTLEAPNFSSKSLIESSYALSSIDQRQKDPLSLSETQDMFSQLSSKTVDQIIIILSKYQMLLKEDETKIESKSLEREEKIRQLQQKKVDEIKEVLAKDQAFLNKVDCAQKIANLAVAISTVVTVAVALGLTGPVGIAALIATPTTTTIFSGLTQLTNTYAKSELEKTESEFILVDKMHKEAGYRMEEITNRLTSLIDDTNSIQETIIKQLKANRRMGQKVSEN